MASVEELTYQNQEMRQQLQQEKTVHHGGSRTTIMKMKLKTRKVAKEKMAQEEPNCLTKLAMTS